MTNFEHKYKTVDEKSKLQFAKTDPQKIKHLDYFKYVV